MMVLRTTIARAATKHGKNKTDLPKLRFDINGPEYDVKLHPPAAL